MIRCRICGRWVGRTQNTFKQLEHIDLHCQENPEQIISQTHLSKNFETVIL